ncbi:MAG: GNAT family N-acetyltransferase [Chloroflexaceae bacterium]|jgi:acetyltransferase|nr:GNAT family N-acetyltransferase [Chloroflexaceae bacterium]
MQMHPDLRYALGKLTQCERLHEAEAWRMARAASQRVRPFGQFVLYLGAAMLQHLGLMRWANQCMRPASFRTRRGLWVAVRPPGPSDVGLLAEFLGGLSEQTRKLRYMGPKRFSAELARQEARRMVAQPGPGYLTLVATVQRQHREEVLAVAELVRHQRNPTVGEVALLVRDDLQRQGIGTALFGELLRQAQRSGVARLHATMLAENSGLLRLVRKRRLPYTSSTHMGETELCIGLAASTQVLPPVQQCVSYKGTEVCGNS